MREGSNMFASTDMQSGRGAAQANHRGVAIPPPPSLNSARPDSQQQRRHGSQQGANASGSSSAPAAGASRSSQHQGRRDRNSRHGAQQGRPHAHSNTPSSRPAHPHGARPHHPRNPSSHQPQHLFAGGRRQPTLDEGVQGLPNPFVHVELEREGVWKGFVTQPTLQTVQSNSARQVPAAASVPHGLHGELIFLEQESTTRPPRALNALIWEISRATGVPQEVDL
eukprot:395875-Pelagomonas_calceolata.AAC.1